MLAVVEVIPYNIQLSMTIVCTDNLFLCSACHTHSPKLGQGMNVSMADSYNLAWKLTRSIPPVSPLTGAIDAASAANPAALLQSYATERRAIAQRLIDIDRQWYALAWSADKDGQQVTTYHQEADALFEEIMTFASGLGVVYTRSFLTHPSTVVSPSSQDSASARTNGESQEAVNAADSKSPASEVRAKQPFCSPAQPGRRLANRLLTRLANGEPRDLHDEILPNSARFFVLIFTGRDIFNFQDSSSKTVQAIFERILPKYNHHNTSCEARVIMPEQVLGAEHNHESEMVSIHDLVDPWTALPACVKRSAEMETFTLSDAGYGYYSLNSTHSTVIVVRPDGWVGARLEVVGEREGSVQGIEEKLDEYLGGIFRRA
jgi:phenol 2-monooxygenase